MSIPTKPQRNQAENKPNPTAPKKRDDSQKHAPNQGPSYSAPGRTDRTDGGAAPELPKISQK